MQFWEVESVVTKTLVDDCERQYVVIEQEEDDELIECVECGTVSNNGVMCINTDDQFCLNCFKKKTDLV